MRIRNRPARILCRDTRDGRRYRCASIVCLVLGSLVPGGAVQAAENRATIEESGGYRIILANGIPDHQPGRFPNSGNPNTIREQRYEFRIPLHPAIQPETRPVAPNLFGVALNGVPFDPGTAEFWNGEPRSGWNYDALSGQINLGLDGNNAHVQPTGAYHYHGIPVGLLRKVAREDEMTLIGYAADGFPVYGPLGYRDPLEPESGLIELRPAYQLREGRRPSGNEGPGGVFDGTFVQDFQYIAGSGDLDECNGRYGVTPEYPNGTYYYVTTSTFPFVPRLWRGTPDESFLRQGPRGGRPPHPHLREDRAGPLDWGPPPHFGSDPPGFRHSIPRR